MAVPNIFANVTTSIPLSQLDTNFATAITLGNTAVYLGNTTTTLGNLTLTNVTLSSGTNNIGSTSISNGTSNVSIASSGGNITMASNGTTAVTVDTSQNVGIGTASPTQKLTVAGSSSLGTASASGNTQIFQTPGNLFLTMNNNGTLGGARRNWAISPEYDVAGGLSFGVGTSEGAVPSSPRLIIKQQGAVVLSGGSTSADGTGITFPASINASSDANTLDDYEEGTFSASCTCTSGTITVNANTCYYTKIGREVSVQGFFTVASVGSPTGALNINGLPFTGAYRSPGISFGDGLSGSASGTWVGDINTGTVIQIYKMVSGVIAVTAAADVQASTLIWFQATYFV